MFLCFCLGNPTEHWVQVKVQERWWWIIMVFWTSAACRFSCVWTLIWIARQNLLTFFNIQPKAQCLSKTGLVMSWSVDIMWLWFLLFCLQPSSTHSCVLNFKLNNKPFHTLNLVEITVAVWKPLIKRLVRLHRKLTIFTFVSWSSSGDASPTNTWPSLVMTHIIMQTYFQLFVWLATSVFLDCSSLRLGVVFRGYLLKTLALTKVRELKSLCALNTTDYTNGCNLIGCSLSLQDRYWYVSIAMFSITSL